MATIQEKILGQMNPSDTSNHSIYSVPLSKTAIFKTLNICNVTASPATYRVFLSKQAVFDTTTALFYDVTLGANDSDVLSLFGAMEEGYNLAVASGTGSALCFTLLGVEITP